MIVFTLAPANIGMLDYDFTYESFAIPLLFLIFKAWDDKKYPVYIISCILLCLVKEQMPLLVMMFGIFISWGNKKNWIKWGLVPFLIGLTAFIVEIFILVPLVRRDLPMSQSYFWSYYFAFGKTPPQILGFLFSHPWGIIGKILSVKNFHWYMDLMGFVGWLAFLSPHIFLIVTPLFLKGLLSSFDLEHNVVASYYGAIFTPFIFLAVWNTLNYIKNKWRLPIHVLVLSLMLIHALAYFPHWQKLIAKKNSRSYELIDQRLIDQIPPQASVLSAWDTLAPLANRKELYAIRSYLDGTYPFMSGRKFELPEHIDYLLLNLNLAHERVYSPPLSRKKLIPKIMALNFSDRWELRESIEDMALLAPNTHETASPQLIEKSDQPMLKGVLDIANLEGAIVLEGIDFPKKFSQHHRIFPVSMYWQCLKKTNVIYKISIKVTLKRKTYYSRTRDIGSDIYPTDFWQKGEYIKENYFYLLPALKPGEYSLKIQFYNNKSLPLNKEIIYTFSVCQ
jgi:hypothetical protein